MGDCACPEAPLLPHHKEMELWYMPDIGRVTRSRQLFLSQAVNSKAVFHFDQSATGGEFLLQQDNGRGPDGLGASASRLKYKERSHDGVR